LVKRGNKEGAAHSLKSRMALGGANLLIFFSELLRSPCPAAIEIFLCSTFSRCLPDFVLQKTRNSRLRGTRVRRACIGRQGWGIRLYECAKREGAACLSKSPTLSAGVSSGLFCHFSCLSPRISVSLEYVVIRCGLKYKYDLFL